MRDYFLSAFVESCIIRLSLLNLDLGISNQLGWVAIKVILLSLALISFPSMCNLLALLSNL